MDVVAVINAVIVLGSFVAGIFTHRNLGPAAPAQPTVPVPPVVPTPANPAQPAPTLGHGLILSWFQSHPELANVVPAIVDLLSQQKRAQGLLEAQALLAQLIQPATPAAPGSKP